MVMDILLYERIKSYILNRMSTDEKAVFEKELAESPDLQREYELTMEIVEGTREVAEMDIESVLKAAEEECRARRPKLTDPAQIEQKIEEIDAELAAWEKSEKRRRRTIIIKFTSYAAAACVALVACTTGMLTYNDHKKGELAYAEIKEQNNDTKASSEIIDAMGKKNKVALKLINESRTFLEEKLAQPANDDPLYLEQLKAEIQELNYLEAICLLRQGRFISARKALKSIIAEDGYYKEDAEKLLGRF